MQGWDQKIRPIKAVSLVLRASGVIFTSTVKFVTGEMSEQFGYKGTLEYLFMRILLIGLLFFVTNVTATTYQFRGTYYDYTGPNNCRLLPAIATIEINNSGSSLVIDAPGAVCPPPQFSDGMSPMLAGLFSNYSIKFKEHSDCVYHHNDPAYFDYHIENNKIVDPVVYSKKVKWPHTIFEVGHHTVFNHCH